jgi:hypothetical protein
VPLCRLDAGWKSHTHTATVLHGERAFLQRLENVLQIIGDLAHDKAIEQRHPVSRAGASENASSGKKAEILQQGFEARRPLRAIRAFRRRDCLRHSPPSVANRAFSRGAITAFPDMLGDFHGERGCAHRVGIEQSSGIIRL